MAREQDYDWVNVWASASGATTDVVAAEPPAEIAAAPAPAAKAVAAPEPVTEIVAPPERALAPRIARFVAAKPAATTPEVHEPKTYETAARIAGPLPAIGAPLPDQLMRDIAEIERVRDALAAGLIGRHMRAFMLVPSRSGTDTAPLLIGGVLALVMLTVFGAAAAVTKFGR